MAPSKSILCQTVFHDNYLVLYKAKKHQLKQMVNMMDLYLLYGFFSLKWKYSDVIDLQSQFIFFFISSKYLDQYWRLAVDMLKSSRRSHPRNLPGDIVLDMGILGYVEIEFKLPECYSFMPNFYYDSLWYLTAALQ